jgi:CRP/FNR family transcriptional regulator, cyclic AMP receptor protein
MENPFTRSYTQDQLDSFEFLTRNRLFSSLNKKEMSEFLPYLHLRMYKQDEVVFFRNDPSQALYLIKEGKVSLELDVADRFETIFIIQKNTSFGNSALLKNTKRLYNAFVSSPFCQIYVVPQVNIMSIFEKKPLIKAKMLEALAENYNELFQVLFRSYRNTQGFFELPEVFQDIAFGA